MMIAVSVSSLVMMGIYSLQLISGRSIKEIYGQTRTRSSRMRALDQIRYRLCEARIGTVNVSQGDHRIEFVDPNLGGNASAFFFVEPTNTLFYDIDINDGAPAVSVLRGPIDITFDLQSAGAMVQLRVKSQAHMAHGDVDVQDGETTVYLRNI